MDYKYIGTLIAEKERIKGINAEILAREIDIDVKEVKKAEKGKRIRKEDLLKIIDYLGIVLF